MSEQTRDLARQMVRLDVEIKQRTQAWRDAYDLEEKREELREARSTMLRLEWAERRHHERRYGDTAA